MPDPEPFSATDYAAESKAIREALFSVSIYDGDSQSVEAFLHEVMSLFRTVKMDEEIFTRLLIVNRLSGRAREAFDNGALTSTLQSFSETLRQRFKQTRSYEALLNQRARMVQKNETVLEYTTRFKKLQRDIILSVLNNDLFSADGKKDIIRNEETQNCLQYVRGLLPEVRERVQPMRPQTIENAYQLARQARDDLSLNRASDTLRLNRFLSATHRQTTEAGPPPGKTTPRRLPHHSRQGKDAARTASPPGQRPPEAANVPRPPGATHKGPLKCFTCGGPHLRYQCPVNVRYMVEEDEDNVVNLQEELLLASPVPPLEEVFFTHSDNDEVICILDFPTGPKTFIIDTGARINIIKSTAIGDCPTEKCVSYFHGISGVPVKTELKITNRGHEFKVVDDSFPIPTDGLLGRSFLCKESVTLEFRPDDHISQKPHTDIVRLNKTLSRADLVLQHCRLAHLDPETKHTIQQIITEYQDTFTLPGEFLAETPLTTHKIETTDEIPIQIKQYRLPPGDRDVVLEQTEEMLANNIIAHSNSPYNYPIRVIAKKMDASGKKKHRIVVDLRRLNDKTPQDNYPIPNITDILDQLGKARYFSAFDLASGFHQIGLDEGSRHKTAFSTPQGHYQFRRMPFGLKNAPATFQRMMDQALRGLIGKGTFVYLDDIIVFGTTLEEHNSNLIKLFIRLREVGLKLQPDKCEILAPELAYLGHLITPEGIKPNPIKLQAVRCFPTPTNKKQIKQFLGLAGYYRKFVKDFSKIAVPLTRLLRKDEDFIFSPACKKAFDQLRNELCSTNVVLQVPDYSKPFILTTDASDYAIGSVLEQLDEQKQRRPVAFVSRTLNPAERNYYTIEKELLAIVWSVKHFRPYLYGRNFKIRTDHQPLTWLFNLKDPSSRLMRWRIKLEEYDYTIEYVQGTSNLVADALSRNPVMLIRWKKHISETPGPSEHAIPVYFSRQAETKFKILRSPEDSSLIGVRISLEKATLQTLTEILEDIVQLLISEEKNLVFLEYEKLVHACLLPANDIAKVVKTVFSDPLIQVELGMQPLLTAHTEEEKRQVISDYHDSLQAGHQGITKTLKMMMRRYYWRGIQKDVHDYIKKCPTCQTSKHDRTDRKACRKIVTLPEKRNEKIALDIVGPLPETTSGFRYILTLQDCLTKFAQAYPLKDQTTASVLDKIISSYLPSQGVPKAILTDQGKNFTAELNEQFCELFKIQHITCTAFHPESNGSLER